MRVLVGCERSGRVRQAFRTRGCDAWSCDIVATTDGSKYHIIADVLDVLTDNWDLGIFFPPCTHLCSSGAQYWPQKRRDGRQRAALDFVLELAECAIPRTAIENPVGILSTVWRKPDQIIQPFMFGEPYFKTTCLWLRGLPLLKPTDIVAPVAHWCSGGNIRGRRKDGTRTRSGLKTMHKRRSEERSLTFTGLADAMGAQWH